MNTFRKLQQSGSHELMERISAELKGRRNGNGWMVLCPAHGDRNPSLSLNEGSDGKLLVKCFAGCPQDSVIEALKHQGLWFDANRGSSSNARPRTIKSVPAELPNKADDIGLPPPGTPAPDMGGASMSWCYRDAIGNPMFYVARIDTPSGKQILPYSWDSQGGIWVNRAWPAPRPLYGLELLAARPTAPVVLVEGEKACDAARDMLGKVYVVVTWPNGAKAYDKSDWTPLHGRKVIIWPDADEPGMRATREIAKLLASHCAVRLIDLDLANPDTFTSVQGFDAADAKALGWDLNSFHEWAKSLTKRVSNDDFEAVSESLFDAKVVRKTSGANKCTTGIRYLDKATGGGVATGDVLVLAAPPGAGKTEMALHMATHNAANGRRVHVFALEAERHELTQRLLYKEIAKLYIESTVYRQAMIGRKLNFADWMDGKFGDVIQDVEKEAEAVVKEKYRTLNVFYRDRDFGIDELTKQVLSIKDKTDLVVIDHAMYIDLPEGPENQAMTTLIKSIRDMALISQKPFIVVAHVRKRDSRNRPLLPELEDLHGTSNFGKIATKAVMIAPCYDPTQQQGEFYTYMRVVKNRRDGSRCRFTAVVTFDVFKNQYKDEFILGRLSADGQKFEPLNPNEMPYWVKD